MAVFLFGIADRVDKNVRSLGGFDGAHHVVCTGVVFSIAENEQRASAGLSHELLGDRVINRIIEGGSQFTIFLRPDFWNTVVGVTIGLQSIENLRSGLREIADQPQVITKADQKD